MRGKIFLTAVSFVPVFLLWFSKASAIDILSEGFRLNRNGGQVFLNNYGACTNITNNNSGADYFIPTKSQAEFNAFKLNSPADIIVNSCQIKKSCMQLLLAQVGLPSGVYTIDPDGAGGNAAFDAYCDMVTDGGGWTMVAYAGTITTNKATTTGTSNFSPLFNVWGTVQTDSKTTKTPFSRMDLFSSISNSNSQFLARRTSVLNKMLIWPVHNKTWWGSNTYGPGSRTFLDNVPLAYLRISTNGSTFTNYTSNVFWTVGGAGSGSYPGISMDVPTYENCDNCGRSLPNLNRRSILYWEDQESYAQWFHASPLTFADSTSANNGNQDIEFYFRESNELYSCSDIYNSAVGTTSGVYFFDPDGSGPLSATKNYCDQTNSGGGWTLVWSNTVGGTNKPVTSITWKDATSGAARCSTANASTSDYTGACSMMSSNLEGFNYFTGLDYWNAAMGNQRYGEFMYRWSPGYGSAVAQAATAKIERFAEFDFYKLKLTDYVQTIGATTAGIYNYHNTRAWTTYDFDNDASGGNCATYYTNTPFWYGACWSGNMNGGGESGGGYGNGAYWTSSTSGAGDVTGNGYGNGWMFIRKYSYYASCLEWKNLGGATTNGVYTIDSDGPGGVSPYNVYCDMSGDGGGWTRVFRHKTNGGYFANASDASEKNVNNPNAYLYSILSRLNHFKAYGYFQFRMNWPGYPKYNHWIQSTNPLDDVDVAGYAPRKIDANTNFWGGLELGNGSHGPTNGNASLLDGSIEHANWYFAIGSYSAWSSGIPSADAVSGSGVSEVELWVRELDFSTTRASCKAYLDNGQSFGDGVYVIDPDGKTGATLPHRVYCDMTTDGGGWTMWYTSDNYYHVADSIVTTATTSYGTAGYSADLRKVPFKEVLYVRHSDGAKDWFTRDSGTNLIVNDYISSGVLSASGSNFGTWTAKGGATTGLSYQLVLGDKSWMQVGLMISGYTSSCWKANNSWCSDTTSNYYRLNGEGNGVTDNGSYGGVAFRQNGHANLSSQKISVGIR